ncbi:tetratricopeptide repeat protein [Hyphococcus sp. DH-69]|uniref:tetratricopeptide repeat protein n=1 Tax=Hyphococcus formosus TaxID=3143534 RepID=UPI00398B7860
MRKMTGVAVVAIMLLSACSNVSADNKASAETDQTEKIVETTSFLGGPLYQQSIAPERDQRLREQISELKSKVSLSEDEYISLGGLYASRRQYQAAIGVYSQGLLKFPNSYKLRRHRGHRYMTVRDLENAIVDFTEALSLIEESEVREYEIDAKGKPHGTYEHWVWYHIGLYYYLHGDYETAASAFERCLKTGDTNDMLIGTTDWLYNIYKRSGHDEKARALVAEISPDIEADRTYPYFKRVMLYKGVVTPDEILDPNKPVSEWNGRDMTVAYGIGNWYAYQGETEKANALHKSVVETPFWSTWAYLAAEKDLSAKQ